MEIERKFLLSGFPDLPELERAEVFQGYLGISPEVRIRSKRVGEAETYRLCFKGEGSLVREEIELDLDKATFESLKKLLPNAAGWTRAQTRNFITLRWNFRISSRQRFFPLLIFWAKRSPMTAAIA